jgi:CDGSH-type Zn-finger protein
VNRGNSLGRRHNAPVTLASMARIAGVNITPSENGPYLVSGVVCLRDVDGRELPHGDYMTLCRCGRSKNKPFCDGMHVQVGFDGTLKS